jgi:hypothetical protein
MNKLLSLYFGIAILVILIVSYFIPVYQTFLYNDIADVKVKSSLLSWIIFSSPWVLGIYILIALGLIWFGIKDIRFKIK